MVYFAPKALHPLVNRPAIQAWIDDVVKATNVTTNVTTNVSWMDEVAASFPSAHNAAPIARMENAVSTWHGIPRPTNGVAATLERQVSTDTWNDHGSAHHPLTIPQFSIGNLDEDVFTSLDWRRELMSPRGPVQNNDYQNGLRTRSRFFDNGLRMTPRLSDLREGSTPCYCPTKGDCRECATACSTQQDKGLSMKLDKRLDDAPHVDATARAHQHVVSNVQTSSEQLDNGPSNYNTSSAAAGMPMFGQSTLGFQQQDLSMTVDASPPAPNFPGAQHAAKRARADSGFEEGEVRAPEHPARRPEGAARSSVSPNADRSSRSRSLSSAGGGPFSVRRRSPPRSLARAQGSSSSSAVTQGSSSTAATAQGSSSTAATAQGSSPSSAPAGWDQRTRDQEEIEMRIWEEREAARREGRAVRKYNQDTKTFEERTPPNQTSQSQGLRDQAAARNGRGRPTGSAQNHGAPAPSTLADQRLPQPAVNASLQFTPATVMPTVVSGRSVPTEPAAMSRRRGRGARPQ